MKKLTIIASSVAFASYSSMTKATDLEIYSAAENGKPTVALMLDTSGSMGRSSPYLDKGWQCGIYRNDYGQGAIYDEKYTGYKVLSTKEYSYNSNGTQFTVTVDEKGCKSGYRTQATDQYGTELYDKDDNPIYTWKEDGRNEIYYGRLTNLKNGVIKLLTDEGRLADNVQMSLGHYADGSRRGKMLLPAKPLGFVWPDKQTQREKLARAINGLTADGATPTAHAYAEVGAHLMGTSTATVSSSTQSLYKVVGAYTEGGSRNYKLLSCDKLYDTPTDTGRYFCETFNSKPLAETWGERAIRRQANEKLPLKPGAITFRAGGYVVYANPAGTRTVQNIDNDDSGMSVSADSTKNSAKSAYVSPLSKPVAECDGQSIYFLTDGSPNSSSTSRSQSLMNKSFNFTNTFSCNSGLRTSMSETGWQCIGEYAKKLRETTNPAQATIKTAVVGFGKFYQDLQLVEGSDEIYDCNSVTNEDVRNTCKWGNKGSGYGEGGFFLASDPDSVAKSIEKTVQDATTEVEPISTGVFSIPVDPIARNSNRNSTYLPQLQPNIGSNDLWKGNLKKYQIKGGAVKGAGGNVITIDGNFNTNTYDFWNDDRTADQGKIDVGGVLSNIFKQTKLIDGVPTVTSDFDRNLFVESSAAGDSCKTLQHISVNVSQPENFSCLDSDYTEQNKRQLVQFMGYPVNDTTVVQDGVALTVKKKAENGTETQETVTRDPLYKTHGTVLHSVPQLITKKATLVNGEVVPNTRRDYMLYGSFDGALRVVNDKTGREVFTFVPKDILKSQGDYLQPNGKSNAKSVRYGVDAPWNIYTDYDIDITRKTKAGASTVEVNANTVIASGGLRMGGSKYYALDITSFSSPKLLYSIGSNYGADGKASPVVAEGTVIDQSYNRMGQTWAKPAIGFVKTGETGTGENKRPVKTMVHFLPGGYDLNYESKKNVTGVQQGNAVYMVKVGPLTLNADNTTTVSTGDAGRKMWWASSSRNGAAGDEAKMTNSIVTEIVPLDRDYDGLTDHIYYADLGGQVFRADIDNSGSSYSVTRVVRVLNVATEKEGDDSAPRFYESPLVTFMRWKGEGRSKNQIVGVVSVGSGNRSKPLHLRDIKSPDRIYTFIDEDLARNDSLFNSGTTLYTQGLTTSDLAPLSFDSSGNESKSPTVKAQMTRKLDTKRGWYFDLQYWEGKRNAKVAGLKVLNRFNAVDGVLFFTTFNPNVSETNAGSCSASVKGATQRDTLCLPYGSCSYRGGASGNGFPSKYDPEYAGKGIVENSFGVLNCQGSNCDKSLVGIVKNAEFSACDIKDPDCNPNKAGVSTSKQMFPQGWKQR